MNAKQIKLNRLSVVLVLVATFVFLATLIVSKTIVDLRSKDKESLVSETVKQKEEPAPAAGPKLPRIKDIEEEEYLEDQPIAEEAQEEEKEEEKELQEFKLKDLPLQTLSPEQQRLIQEDLEGEGPALKTEPTLEDLKRIKKKGLIIF